MDACADELGLFARRPKYIQKRKLSHYRLVPLAELGDACALTAATPLSVRGVLSCFCVPIGLVAKALDQVVDEDADLH